MPSSTITTVTFFPLDVNDPGLSKFALMVRCLMQEQGQGPKSQLGAWEELARGQFPPNWNQKGGINEDELRRNFGKFCPTNYSTDIDTSF